MASSVILPIRDQAESSPITEDHSGRQQEIQCHTIRDVHSADGSETEEAMDQDIDTIMSC